jgi:murein DD-endopeptidase MepM/ murein hydrolase activator NlpD
MRVAASALIVLSACAALAAPAPALAAGDASVAALQVALRAKRVYAGPVDGVPGPATAAAVRKLQRRAGLTVDGVAGPRTRRALGKYGRPAFGARTLVHGVRGWDVAELQFRLALHGFPSGPFDGTLGARTDRALRAFQRWAGMTVDGRAGPATIAALRAPPVRCPIRLVAPVAGVPTDFFGPRGVRFHAGVDYALPSGTPVVAAGSGRVTWAGWRNDGYGYSVIVTHAAGVETLYAHLSRVTVARGQTVAAGVLVGRVGSTGASTGPHLHFEVHLRGAALDPLAALT